MPSAPRGGVVQEHQREQAERLGLVGHQHGEQLREADRLVAERGAHGLRAARRRVALVEDEVEDGEHRAEPVGEQVVGRDAEGDAAVSAFRFARTSRCAIVGSGTRNACAICAVVSPATSRSVSATRDSAASAVAAGEDEREAVVGDRAHVVLLGRQRLEPCEQLRLAGERLLAAEPVDARLRAVVMTHAPGLRGVPSRGQRSSAVANASCTASSARSRSPRTRVRTATARPHSSRNACDRLRQCSMTGLSSTEARTATGSGGDRDRRVEVLHPISMTPPICSFVSAYGPSVTIVSPSRTRTVFAVAGRRARSRAEGAGRAELAEERLHFGTSFGAGGLRLFRRHPAQPAMSSASLVRSAAYFTTPPLRRRRPAAPRSRRAERRGSSPPTCRPRRSSRTRRRSSRRAPPSTRRRARR